MGVSIEIYRCRIGIYNLSGPRSACATKSSNAGLGLLMQILCALTLLIILLVGGIELNPGPQHQCKACHALFTSNKAYFHHMLVHQSISHKTGVPCSRRSCKSILTTVSSLNSHMTKFHTVKKTITSEDKIILCPADGCEKEFTDFPTWKSHALQDHLSKGVSIKCVFKSCKYISRTDGAFRTHLTRCHPGKAETLFEAIALIRQKSSVEIEDDNCSDHVTIPDVGNVQEEEDPYPPWIIIDRISRFYLTLESNNVLPTTTVQMISEEIALFSRFTHHRLKRALKEELKREGMEESCASRIISNVFIKDPVFNTHHKGFDSVQLMTDHLRCVHWKKNYKFVPPVPVDLGETEGGKKKIAQHVSIKDSLKNLLEDESVRSEVLKSFRANIDSSEILSDFIHGTKFQEHINSEHGGRCECILLFLFQDGFDPNAFSTGNHKPIGFYYTIGNIPPEERSNLNLIQLAYMVLEKDLKNTEKEELDDVDKLKLALDPLIKELIDLKNTGISIDGKMVPVCLLYFIGDSLGQNYIANIVRSFSSEFSCRFCPMPRSTFLRRPWQVFALRKPEDYDRSVKLAKIMWNRYRTEALRLQKTRKKSALKRVRKVAARCSAPSKKDQTSVISKTAFEKLQQISHTGVKYRSCPFNNKDLKFHIIGSQPPCISHDLHEGIFKAVVPQILKHFIEVKKWFDLKELNSRILCFKCHGTDSNDRPKPLKNLKSLAGHAVENWNFVRLLPLMIGDLIVDKEDTHWKIFLQLQEISELVSAPRISRRQVLTILSDLIKKYLENIKQFLKKFLSAKHHYLAHYPELILMFGPLIRLFTLRFESKHAFFKRVMRACNSFTNVTFTMARKHACRAALDRATKLIPDPVQLISRPSCLDKHLLPEPARTLIPDNLEERKKVKIHGTEYSRGLLLLLGGTYEDLKVGEILNVLWDPVEGNVSFLVQDSVGKKVRNGGFHKLHKEMSYQVVDAKSLPDYYPLSAYTFQESECLVLKHTSPFMHE